MGIGTAAGAVGPSQPAMDVETASYDSARFVRGMWDFFNRYKDLLSYECYFNSRGEHGDHRIDPAEYNPRASAAYRRLWNP
jgi:hypothetical protein